MATHLAVTIDTEADNLWARPLTYSCRNIEYLPVLQAVFDRLQVRATYLVSHEVVDSPESVAILQQIASRSPVEIGTHLHPFSTPPEHRMDDRQAQPYATEYPVEAIDAKLRVLTDTIEARLGIRPRSIRWGRWGLNAALVPLMEARGYTVDTTVTPGIVWPDSRGVRPASGSSFVDAPAGPYYLSRHDVCRPGSSPILEAPVTIHAAPVLAPVHRALERLHLGRLGRRLGLAPVWLRPFPWVAPSALVNLAPRPGTARGTLLTMMFHSSELLPGENPYFRDGAAGLVPYLERVLVGLLEQGVRSVTLQDLPLLAQQGALAVTRDPSTVGVRRQHDVEAGRR